MTPETANTVLVYIQSVTLIALVIYVFKTWQMASATKDAAESAAKTVYEMKTAREAEYRPYVVAYFDILRNNIILLTLKNLGRSQAINVTVEFEPEIEATDKDKIRGILSRSFKGISLQPQQELTTYIDQVSRYLGNKDFPRAYKALVKYDGSSSAQPYNDMFLLDIGVYEGLLVVDAKDMAALVDELRSINPKVSSMATALKAIEGKLPESN